MGVYVNMPITILSFLGNNKAIVLVTGYINIATSNVAGTYGASAYLPKTVLMLACWHAFGPQTKWYPDNILNTAITVFLGTTEYQVQYALGLPIDRIKIYVYQSDDVAKIVNRAYFVLGVMDL